MVLLRSTTNRRGKQRKKEKNDILFYYPCLFTNYHDFAIDYLSSIDMFIMVNSSLSKTP